jgi:hypothetical protein
MPPGAPSANVTAFDIGGPCQGGPPIEPVAHEAWVDQYRAKMAARACA